MRVLLLGFVATLSLSTSAIAQPSKASDVHKMASSDCARARAAGKTCVLNIEDGDVHEGEVPRGDGQGFTGIDFGKAGSLIRLRRDFIREIIKSAEDL